MRTDYLAIAKTRLGWTMQWGDESPTSANIVGQQAIAAALIALVERLDKLTDTWNGEQGALRILPTIIKTD